MMFSLAIGLLIMMLFDSSIHSCTSIVLLGCLISLAHFCDLSYLIPAWTIIFFCYYERDRKKMAVFFVLASVTLQTLVYGKQFDSFASFSFQYGTLLSLIPIMLYNGERGNIRHNNLNRWFFYVYYPAHMVLLLVIRASVKMLSQS
ncbi:MAG: conjugal transfer protein TraX [Oscillospiraceae bacterium]|nr:conjugal transfer protein TraX [Oscillospiraceae bacterium]